MNTNTNPPDLGELLEPEIIAKRLRILGDLSFSDVRRRFYAFVHREGVPFVRVSQRRILFPSAPFEKWLMERGNNLNPAKD